MPPKPLNRPGWWEDSRGLLPAEREPDWLFFFDEVGRGAFFGPVSFGVIALNRELYQQTLQAPWAAGIDDSKVLKPAHRHELAGYLRATYPCATGHASAAIINRLGLRAAMEVALIRGIERVVRRIPESRMNMGLIGDGHFVFQDLRLRQLPARFIVKADATIWGVAAASVLAKSDRDRRIESIARRYAGYGLEQNAGYGTAGHRQAIRQLGPTRHHRISFLRKLTNS